MTPHVHHPKTKNELAELLKEEMQTLGLHGNFNHIDVSNIKDMSTLFSYSEFEGDISEWDVSNVLNAECMFYRARFNGDISQWRFPPQAGLQEMFSSSGFRGDLSQWAFPAYLEKSNPAPMFGWPAGSRHLGGNWESLRIPVWPITFQVLFGYDELTSRDIARWNTSRVEDMDGMFEDSLFTGDIANWDVSNVLTMVYMFAGSVFNGDISRWDTRSVITMFSMFESSQFNSSLANWNIESLQTTRKMFKNSAFNSDISGWDIQHLLECDMHRMFWGSAFKGDLSGWVVSSTHTQGHVFELLGEGFQGKPPSTTVSDAKALYTRMFGSVDAVAQYAGTNPFGALHLNLSLQADTCPKGVDAQDYAWVQEQKSMGESLGLSLLEIQAHALVQYESLGKEAPADSLPNVSELFESFVSS